MSEKTIQIKPLGTGAPIWEHDTSDYPDLMKMPMENGQVITYQRVIDQPHPQCLKSIDLIKVMKKHVYGGCGYLPKHEKK